MKLVKLIFRAMWNGARAGMKAWSSKEAFLNGLAAGAETVKVKVWEVNDTEWWAGTDLDSIKAAYHEITGIDPNDEDEGFQDPHQLSDAEMEKLTYVDEEGEFKVKRTFKEQLHLIITTGKQKFPCMFATTEW